MSATSRKRATSAHDLQVLDLKAIQRQHEPRRARPCGCNAVTIIPIGFVWGRRSSAGRSPSVRAAEKKKRGSSCRTIRVTRLAILAWASSGAAFMRPKVQNTGQPASLSRTTPGNGGSVCGSSGGSESHAVPVFLSSRGSSMINDQTPMVNKSSAPPRK